jgi:hypothetical protein
MIWFWVVIMSIILYLCHHVMVIVILILLVLRIGFGGDGIGTCRCDADGSRLLSGAMLEACG